MRFVLQSLPGNSHLFPIRILDISCLLIVFFKIQVEIFLVLGVMSDSFLPFVTWAFWNYLHYETLNPRSSVLAGFL